MLISELLAQHPALEELNLGGNNLGEVGAVHLARAIILAPSLKCLDLSDTGLGDMGVSWVASALKSGSASVGRLQELRLCRNEITSAGALALAQMLGTNTMLHTLAVGSNPLGNLGVSNLATSLEANTTLTSLEIGGVDLTVAGLRALTGALELNTTLAVLRLPRNDFGEDDPVRGLGLVSLLVLGQGRHVVDLEACELRADGMSQLGEALAASALRELRLSRNDELDDAALLGLLFGMARCSSLEAITLDHTGITDAGAEGLREVVLANPTLCRISVVGTGVSPGSRALLDAHLAANRLYGGRWTKESHATFPAEFKAVTVALIATRALAPATHELSFPLDVFEELCEDMRQHRHAATRADGQFAAAPV